MNWRIEAAMPKLKALSGINEIIVEDANNVSIKIDTCDIETAALIGRITQEFGIALTVNK